MRFDEFVKQQHIDVLSVEGFEGFSVGVELPPDWAQVEAVDGLRVWVGANEPRSGEFCPNAVLNLYRVESLVEPGDLFSMLCEQQSQSVPGCRESYRDLAVAAEGPGVAGTLVLQIAHELGTIDSATRTRIVATEQETLIAQLTITALHDSTQRSPQFGLAIVVGDAQALR